jgi:hypothetical protein
MDLDELKKKYPLCFQIEGCCFTGFECGEGWFGVLHELLDKLERRIAENPDKYLKAEVPFQIDQIKEKFGGLRFYIAGHPIDEDVWDWIIEAEEKCWNTCEICGKPGEHCSTKSKMWLKTLCSEHAEQKEYIPYKRNEQ